MKKMKLWIKIVLSVFIIILLVGGAAFSYTFFQLSKINTTIISKTDADLGIKPKAPPKEIPTKEKIPLEENSNEILNIAFFGLDRTDVNESGRSDSIMILSIDEKHKKISKATRRSAKDPWGMWTIRERPKRRLGEDGTSDAN